MKILIVSKDPTHPTTAGNRAWILAQAEKLQALGNEVHFLYVEELPLRRARKSEYADALHRTKEFWGERFHLFRVSSVQKLWFNVLYRLRIVFCKRTTGIDDDYPCGLARYVNKLNGSFAFGLCIVNYYFLTRLLLKIGIPANAVFTHDCFAYKDQVVGEPILHIDSHGEARAMQRSQAVIAIQSEEADYFRIIAPRSKVYTFFSHYDYHPQPVCSNHGLLFLSGGNQFNVNGLNWFIKDIFPIIKERFPDAFLMVGGSICNQRGAFPETDGVEYTGYVEDAASFYSRADVAINPVFQGTGLKIKTFEAVSFDKVTLVHPHSTRGIFNPSDAPVLVADGADAWVAHLEKVWGDESFLKQIKLKNCRYMEELDSYVDSEYKRFLNDCSKR